MKIPTIFGRPPFWAFLYLPMMLMCTLSCSKNQEQVLDNTNRTEAERNIEIRSFQPFVIEPSGLATIVDSSGSTVVFRMAAGYNYIWRENTVSSTWHELTDYDVEVTCSCLEGGGTCGVGQIGGFKDGDPWEWECKKRNGCTNCEMNVIINSTSIDNSVTIRLTE